MEKIVLVGFGGHAKSVANSIESCGLYEIGGYTDIEPCPEVSYRYLGTDDELEKIYSSGVRNAAITIGQVKSSSPRFNAYNRLKAIGYDLPVIIDPFAIVADNARIGEGTFIGKGAIVNACADIGRACIINSGSICEHNDKVGNFTHIAVGAVCCGNVTIGSHTLIGANATVIQEIHVGDNVIIGAGAVVLNDVEPNCTYVGIPAQKVENGL